MAMPYSRGEQSSQVDALVAEFSRTLPFPLDPFQREAIAALAAGQSVLVAAPTGTGKTAVAESAIWMALREGKRAFYTAPIKAISNQKFRDFRERFGTEQVGLMTGDIVENASAPIVVMTTEIYRNVLLEIERGDSTVATTDFAGSVTVEAAPGGQRHLDLRLDRIAFVIFDELHFMADPQRGPVWEECIIHSPPHVRFAGLSATVRNASEMVAWMAAVHGPTQLIFHPERAVPLEDYYFYDNKLWLVRDAAGQRVNRFPGVGGEAKRRGAFRRWELLEDEDDEDIEPWRGAPQPGEVLAALRKADLLPCLYFLPGRRAVEDAAHAAAHARLTDDVTAAIIADEIDRWLDRLAGEDRALQQVQELTHLLPLGMAYHHAGLMPSLKVLVETLFARGLLQAVFATDTLAMGVNMPARAVVLGSLSKFDGTTMRLMTPNEYQQLTGRAGRRGMDERGAAVILYSPWEEFEACFTTLTKPLLPVSSAFTMRYNSVLNLWRPGSFERLRHVAAASFLEYHRRMRQAAKRDRQQHDQEPKGKKSKKAPHPAPADVDAGIELGNSVEHELIATTTILRMFGYLDEVTDDLSLRGRLLRAIFHPAGLALSELILAGALDDLTSAELAEVVSWFTYDSDRPLWSADVLSERLKIARRAARGMVERVRRVEFQQGLTPSPALNEHFMGVALGWSQRLSLGALRQRISLAEGDLLMVLNQTIDLLRQLESAAGQLLADTRLWTAEISPMLSWAERRELRQRFDRMKATLGLAARSLIHGTVAQSRRLPFDVAGLPAPPEVAGDEAQRSPGVERNLHGSL
jgi:ATP-dependent RNA helicase HelY